MMHRRHSERGFTLIELLIVIAIIAILAAILIPNFLRSRAASLLASCQLDLRNIAAALELYNGENMAYPPDGSWESDLISGGYIRAVPHSPIDGAAYAYATNASRTNFTLADGPDKYLQAGISGYVVYTPTGGLEVGAGSIPSP